MIITELSDQVEDEMDAMVRQGVSSFKLFMAYPGVFMLDDASIFRAMLRTGKNGGVVDVRVKKALAEGKAGAHDGFASHDAAIGGDGLAADARGGRDDDFVGHG